MDAVTFGERVSVMLTDGLPECEGVPEMRGVADSDAERDGEPDEEVDTFLDVGLGRDDCVKDTVLDDVREKGEDGEKDAEPVSEFPDVTVCV